MQQTSSESVSPHPLTSSSVKQKNSREVTFREAPQSPESRGSIKESRSIRSNREDYLNGFQSRSRSNSNKRPPTSKEQKPVVVVPPRRKNFVPEIPPIISAKVSQMLERKQSQLLLIDRPQLDDNSLTSYRSSQQSRSSLTDH